MNQIVTRPKRAYRHQVLAAIKSGQYTVEIAGTVVTDFKKIEEVFGAWPRPRSEKGVSQLNRALARDGNLCHWCRKPCDSSTKDLCPVKDHRVDFDKGRNAFENIIVACTKCKHERNAEKQRRDPKNPKPIGALHPAVIVDASTHLVVQYEHFGDAIVLIAARVISHEVHGKNKRAYLPWISELVSNKNLATYPGIRHADQFEVIIGQEFVLSGIEPAFDTAKQMLRETKSYLDCVPDSPTPDPSP